MTKKKAYVCYRCRSRSLIYKSSDVYWDEGTQSLRVDAVDEVWCNICNAETTDEEVELIPLLDEVTP